MQSSWKDIRQLQAIPIKIKLKKYLLSYPSTAALLSFTTSHDTSNSIISWDGLKQTSLDARNQPVATWQEERNRKDGEVCVGLGLKDEMDVLKVPIASTVFTCPGWWIDRISWNKTACSAAFPILLCQFENGTQGLSAQWETMLFSHVLTWWSSPPAIHKTDDIECKSFFESFIRALSTL